ncbi:hypothetical protein [Streptomyces sp. SBT349]|uniref:hypothetical protein n=1 Tax=Streptomyces sp. SBT349 TaxID=1580539 RepID=UPI00066DCADF|nr:hypothetical protein [Streptomyces sp. SBT349]
MRDARGTRSAAAEAVSDGVALLLPLTLLGIALVVVLYVLARRSAPGPFPGGRARYRAEVRRTEPHRWAGRPTAPPAEARAQAADASPEALDARARGLLIRLDDAVLRRTEELGFAGDSPEAAEAAEGQRATAAARAEADAALRLRHRLDDPALERNETERRRLLHEIIDRCSGALARLAERGTSAATPEALARARERAAALPARLEEASATLRRVGGRYAPVALAPVRGHPVAGRERLAEAGHGLDRAERALAGGQGGREAAADALRGAEAAIGQAERLTEGLTRWTAELTRADKALDEAVLATEADVAEAPGLPALRTPVARAQRALEAVRRADERGRRDPFGGLRRLTKAGAPLAGALAPDRHRETRNRRARTLLEEALLTAGGELSATRDYVATHRGEVGSPARTRLAEAGHQLRRALGTGPHDADAALPFAWRADALARRARALATRDAGAAP